MWPSYTDLVRGRSGDYNLTAQNHEVKVVIRKALPQLLGKLCFDDFYPASTTRAAWNKEVLITAAGKLKRKMAQNKQSAAAHYGRIRDRLRADDGYYPILGKLVR